MSCPNCGAEDLGNALYKCGSYAVGDQNAQSRFCAEREAHNETNRKLNIARERIDQLLTVPFDGETQARVMHYIAIAIKEEIK